MKFRGLFATTAALFLTFASPASAQPDQLTILSGSPGGTWYPIAAGIAEIFGSEGVTANAEVGAGVANYARIASHHAELGMTTSTVPPVARTGQEPFNKPIADVRALAVLFPSHQHIAVRRDAGIGSIADLAGQSFNCMAIGNSTQAAFADAVKAAGISESDVSCTRGSQTFAADAVKDGNNIGLTLLSGYPNGTYTELFSSVDMQLLPISKEIYEKVKSKNPGYGFSVIPAGTYPGQEKEIPVLRSDLLLVAHKDMTEADAYWVTKTLLERIDDLKRVHAVMRPITPEYMAEVSGIDLHPGAARAFKEAGVTLKSQGN